MTEAMIPGTRMIPSAPTGVPKLSRIDGHSRPKAELGRATLRYARQARRRAGTGGNFLSEGKRDRRAAQLSSTR
jgi:hypothetical protein